MLPILLSLPLQGVSSIPHAELHPADSVLIQGIHDLTRSGEAYGAAPAFRFARDERILTLLEVASGTPIDPTLIAPAPLFDLLIDELPPEARAMGLDELLAEVRRLSISYTASSDFGAALDALLRVVWTHVELNQAATLLRERSPDDPLVSLEALGDPGLAVDAWGHPYRLAAIPDLGFELRSFGANGEAGGEGLDADIVATPLGAPEPRPAIMQPVLDAMGSQVVLEFASDVGAERLMSLVELSTLELPAEVTLDRFSVEAGSTALEGLSFRIDADGVSIPLWIGARESLVVFGFGVVAPEGVAARLADPAPLAEAVGAGIAALPVRAGEPLFTTYQRYTTLAYLDLLLGIALRTGGAEATAREVEVVSADQLMALVERLEVDRRPRVSRSTLVGSTFHTDVLRPGSPRQSDSAPSRLSADDFETLHPESALVWAGEVALDDVYDILLEIGAAIQGVDAEEYHRQAVDLLGLDLRADLLSQIEPILVASLDPIQGIGAPKVMVHARVRDPERVSAALSAVVESVAAAMPDEFEAQTRPYRDMPLARLALKGLGLPISIEPSFGLHGDRLLVGLTGTHVKKELRRLSKGELEPHPMFTGGRVELAEGTTSLTYFDWPTFLSKAYDMGLAVAGIGGGLPPEVPLSLDQLPDSDIFAEYFEPTVVTVEQTPQGLWRHTVASFGPELGLLLQSASFANNAFFAEESGFVVAVPPDPPAPSTPADPAERTSAAISSVRVALQVYFYEHDSAYPDSLSALSDPTEAFPDGVLEGSALPDDGWSRPLRYAVDPAKDGYRLWSVGPDGIDQEGAGDDIVVTVR